MMTEKNGTNLGTIRFVTRSKIKNKVGVLRQVNLVTLIYLLYGPFNLVSIPSQENTIGRVFVTLIASVCS